MEKIDRFSLLKAVFNCKKTEKIPYSLWKHFIEADKTAEGLAEAQIEFQKRFSNDLMKISPHGSYCVVDFGGILGGYRPISGSRICERTPIISLADWETIEPVDPNDGEFGAQVKAVELINRQVENEVPTMMTIFSPFMVAAKLDPSLLEHIHQDKKLILSQIKMLTDVMTEFATAILDAGSDGLFIATQHFNNILGQENIHDFEFNPIKSLILKSIPKSSFNILHLHGKDPFFRLATELPNISAINWHDQETSPNLNEARQDFYGGLLGGIDEVNVLTTNNKEEVAQSIKKIYREYDGRGLIFAPGCVIPQGVSNEILQIVTTTVNSLIPI